jgi:superfamily II DNA or RNA helicase
MKKNLNNIDFFDLQSIVGLERIQHMKEIVSYADENLNEKDILINTVLAVYGKDLLSEKNIRLLIFNTIEENTLGELSKKYSKKKYPKKYDNALELSLLPWKNGSEFVDEISILLDIPNDFLPQPKQNNVTSYEVKIIKDLLPLHSYQTDVKNQIIENLESGVKKFLVQMPTGSGKTRTTLQSIIEYLGSKNPNNNQEQIILWLAHTEELCEQALETFNSIWPHIGKRSIHVSRCWGAYEPSLENIKGGIVFGTLQKFVSLYNSKSYFLEFISNKLNILVIDEAHKSVAVSYSQVINYLIQKKSRLIGVTATPGRNFNNHSENLLLSSFFNKNLVTPFFNDNPIKELQNLGILSKLKRVVINTNVNVRFNYSEFDIEKSSDLPNTTINKLAINTSRNKRIIEIIESEIKNGNPCLVFACNNDHSKLLNAALNLKNIKSNYIDFKTNPYNRKKVISDFKEAKFDVLINYGILSTGFDAPRIRSIVVTRPTSSIVLYSQIIGRGLRGVKMGGGSECNLFDLKDNFENFGGVDEVYNYFDGYWD